MVIHKIESEERKGVQQSVMLIDSRYKWIKLYSTDHFYNYKNDYPSIMNMKTYGGINELIVLTYFNKPNKW